MHRTSPARAVLGTLVAVLIIVAAPLTELGCTEESAPVGPEPSPNCALEPDTLHFGRVAMDRTADRTATIRNSGQGSLSGAVPDACGAFRIVEGAGLFSLGAGEAMPLVVRFAPRSVHPETCSVPLGEMCAPLTLIGEGGEAPPLCVVRPDTLEFGVMLPDSTAERAFTIRNAGGGRLSGTVSVGCGQFTIVEGGGAYDLGAEESLRVTISFQSQQCGLFSCDVRTGLEDCGRVRCRGEAAGSRLLVSPAEVDFGAVPLGSYAERLISVTNDGCATLGGVIAVDCPEYQIRTGGGAYTLFRGQSRRVVLRFTPSSCDSARCVLKLGGESAGVPCVGAGQGVRCEVAPERLEFGTVPVGEAVERSFSVRNVGCEALTVDPAADCAAFALAGDPGPFTIGPGEERQVAVRCTPSECGAASCTVTLGLPGAPDVLCAASGGSVVCAVDPVLLDFGSMSVGESADRTLRIENRGCDAFSGTLESPCPELTVVGSAMYVLRPGQAHEVAVRFTPTAAGDWRCALRTGNEACAEVACVGWGTVAACDLIPPSVDFGSVPLGLSADRTFTIESVGSGRLAGDVVSLCDRYTILEGGGPFDLAPGERRYVTVRFTPERCGTAECLLATGNAACGAIPCTGEGTAASCLVRPDSLDFGAVDLGRSDERSLVLRNDGCQMVAGALHAACADFEIVSGGGSYQLAPGDSLVARVRFVPSGCEASRCRITTGSDDCPDLVCVGTGGGLACSLDTATLRFGEVALGAFADRSFSITNDGCATARGAVVASCADYAITEGGGDYELAAGETRLVTVRFRPTACGVTPCTILTGIPECGDVTCTGEGTGGSCAVEPNAVDFGEVAVGAFAERHVAIRNTGCEALSGTVTEACSDFSITEGAGAYVLEPGESRQLTVRFTPSGCGAHSCDVATGSAFCPAVRVTGAGGGSICGIEPASLQFGNVALGDAVDRQLTITNEGCADLVGSVSEGCSGYQITAGGGAYRLGPGQARIVTVRFAPSACGDARCTIQTGDAACSTVACEGTGGGSRCTVTPEQIDYGSVPVGEHADRTLTLVNAGCTTLTGSIAESCPEFTIVSGGGPYSLSPGQERQVTVRFEPAACGPADCLLETGSTLCTDVPLTGTGGGSVCVVEPASLSFEDVMLGETSDRSFVIRNDGCDPLSGTVAEDCGEYSIVEGGGPYVLQANEERTVTVRFAPAECGLRPCLIETGNTDCPDVNCYGTGTALHCAVAPTSLDFGGVPPGSYSERSFTITNDGCDRLTGIVTEDCPDFTIRSGEGAYDLAPGDQRVVVVWFAPESIGLKSCTIETGSLACPAVLCSGCSAPPSPQTVYAWSDATIRSDLADSTGCGQTVDTIGFDPVSGESSTLVAFDLTGIPPGARVTGVRLDLYAAGCDPDAGEIDVVVDRIDEAWDECTVTWAGAPRSVPRDCQRTIFCDTEQYYLFNCADLVPVVQSWIDDPETNHGLMLRAAGAADGAVRIRSHRYPEQGSRPRIRVTFACP